MEKNTILSINNYEEIKIKNNNNNRNKKHKKIINYENDFVVKYLGKLCVFGEIILLIIYNYSLFNYYIIPIIKNKPLNIFLVKYSKFNILISIFVILDLILCFISFFVTYFTPPATVPNNSIFYSYLNENLNQNKLLNILNNNRNKIPKQINNNNNNNINLNYIPFINSSSILEIQSQKTHSFSPNNRYTFKEDFILPKIQINKEQKTLILDLDETLIHSSFSKFVEEPDFIIEVKFY